MLKLTYHSRLCNSDEGEEAQQRLSNNGSIFTSAWVITHKQWVSREAELPPALQCHAAAHDAAQVSLVSVSCFCSDDQLLPVQCSLMFEPSFGFVLMGVRAALVVFKSWSVPVFSDVLAQFKLIIHLYFSPVSAQYSLVFTGSVDRLHCCLVFQLWFGTMFYLILFS